MKSKTVYVLQTRETDNGLWSKPTYYRTKKERDKDASVNRIIGGLRTHSFQHKKSLDEIEQIFFKQ